MRTRFRVAVLIVAALLAGALTSASADESAAPERGRPLIPHNDGFRRAVVIRGTGVADTVNTAYVGGDYGNREPCEQTLTPWGRDTLARARTMAPLPRASGPDELLAATSHDSATRYVGAMDTTSVWWQWTAGRTRRVRIDTGRSTMGGGRDLNTMLAVYRGRAPHRNLCEARPLISQVAWDDNSGLGRTSRVQFRAVRGRHYYILVDGFPQWDCHTGAGLPPGEVVCSVDGVGGYVRVRLSNG